MEPWRQFLAANVPAHEVATPAPPEEISLAEDRLGVAFPPELKTLLLETNGVTIEYGIHLIWPLERIVEENLRIRFDKDSQDRYMPLDCLLFFADAGNGDLFGYAIVKGDVRSADVFAWSHEDDSRAVVATSLGRFIKGWTNGTIKL